MRGRTWGVVTAALMLSGCATTVPPGKPILTKRAFHRIAARCGVRPVSYRHDGRHLPQVAFVYRDAAAETDQHAAPSVECGGAALKAYRYDYYSPMSDPPRAEE